MWKRRICAIAEHLPPAYLFVSFSRQTAARSDGMIPTTSTERLAVQDQAALSGPISTIGYDIAATPDGCRGRRRTPLETLALSENCRRRFAMACELLSSSRMTGRTCQPPGSDGSDQAWWLPHSREPRAFANLRASSVVCLLPLVRGCRTKVLEHGRKSRVPKFGSSGSEEPSRCT